MKEDLMRRISAALDSADGLAGDPALQEEMRAHPASAKYAKDLTRVGKWLGTWPLPEPDDAAFEALAARIEQRLDEPLGAIADPTAPPAFDDDDAIRDATVGLLQSGEYRVSDSAIEILSDSALAVPEAVQTATPPPSETSQPTSPIARVTLNKARVPAIVEESSGTGEPLSAADLELRLKSDPGTPKKKKKKKPAAAAAAAEPDRISIPTPKPSRAAPTLSPVVQLPKPEEKKPAGVFWWFAAAAAIGLGVFGSATLYESEGAPAASARHGSTLVTTGTVAPTAAAAPIELDVPTVPAAPEMPPASIVTAMPTAHFEEEVAPQAAGRARLRDAPTPSAEPYAPARVSGTGGAATAHSTRAGAGDRAPIGDDALAGPVETRRSAAPIDPPSTEAAAPVAPTPRPTTTPTTTTTTTTTAPAPSPPPPPTSTGDLPDSPDRSTIQAVLAARLAAVTACANGAHGLADVDIVISSSGRITTATVNGPFAGTPVGSCIARAVRGATFPPFSQPRFEVTYPYHL